MDQTTALATRPDTAVDVVERVVMAGDLSKLSAGERVAYYKATCDSLGLNPLTRPFEYITLNGKLTLYARRDATDQLRKLHGVSVSIVSRDVVDDVYVVTARAALPDGRSDESIGAVSVKGLAGEPRANALMKAETKAKRRVTLSIVGLGLLDESETTSIPDARPVRVDVVTGEIEDEPKGTAQQQTARQEPHWAQRADVLAKFWPWTETLGLSHAEVHKALGVEHLRDFGGTMADAKAMITRYVSDQADGEGEDA
jgi:hypothetical protein